MSQVWQLRLADQVEVDLRDIASWTTENFGPSQADEYLETVMLALEALCDGPALLGVKERGDIGPEIRTLHVARLGRKGRHFVVFKPGLGQTIDVLRVLYDRMDLTAHWPGQRDSLH